MRNSILCRLAAVALCGTAFSAAAASTPAAGAQLISHHIIDATAFTASKMDFATTYVISAAEGLRNVATAYGLFNMGLHLPHGATIKRVTVLYRSGPFSTPCFTLIRTRLSDGSADTVASGSFDDDGNQPTAEAIAVLAERGLIDNRTYAYGLGLCLGGSSGDAFYSARITYSYVD